MASRISRMETGERHGGVPAPFRRTHQETSMNALKIEGFRKQGHEYF